MELNSSEHKNKYNYTDTNYQSNNWSQYQIMVLKTLEDHTKILKELSTDINSVKERLNIAEVVHQNWRSNYDKMLTLLKSEIDFNSEEIKKIDNRVKKIENDDVISEKISVKTKAFWGILGGIFVILIDIVSKLFDFIIKK